MSVSVQEVLATPVLSDARVIAGGAGVEREVRWMAVIEWPVEDFVRPGEFVLTTFLGCDSPRIEQFMRTVVDAEAAALCVTFQEEGALPPLPASIFELAEKRSFPIIQVPWHVRFAEIMMALADRLIAHQYAAALQEPDRLLGSLTAAVLAGGGLGSIAEALEGMLHRPVLILDAELRALGHGRLAAVALSDALAGWGPRVEALRADDLQRLKAQLDAPSARHVSSMPDLGLPGGMAVAAAARRRPVAYVYVLLDDATPTIPTLEARALEHAAIAVGMEMLRLRSAAEAEATVRGDFLWSLATGMAGSRDEAAAKAALLGYDVRSRFNVALARGTGEHEEDRIECVERTADRLRKTAGRAVIVSRRSEQLLVLQPEPARDGLSGILNRIERSTPASARASWGIANGAVALLDLVDGYRGAQGALEVGAVVLGAGAVADAHRLGGYLMLDKLARDADAVAASRAVLEPILAYDRDKSRDLLRTLEVYLRENGNTSAAARALYLNRHSLLYRLRKIEALTGRSVDTYEDRFMLDLSAKLLRLVERRGELSRDGRHAVG